MKAQSLVTIVRNLPGGEDRRVRATFLAKVFAYRQPINTVEDSFDDVFENGCVAFKSALQEVNETILVDTSLAMSIYKSLLHARYQVASNECDNTLMSYILCSSTTQDDINQDTNNALVAVCKNEEFKRLCREAKTVLDSGEG